MKMITAIINKTDAGTVCDVLTKNGFAYTKIGSTGGFLRSGNTTLLMGTEDDQVEQALNLIRRHSEKRTIEMPVPLMQESYMTPIYTPTTPVVVGGAVVFVSPVERCEKM